MHSLDGISGQARRSRPRQSTSSPSPAAPRRRLGRNGLGLIGLGCAVLVIAWIAIRLTGHDLLTEQSTDQSTSTTSPASEGDDLPFHFQVSQGSGTAAASVFLVVLYTLTETSLPQQDGEPTIKGEIAPATEGVSDFTVRILNGGGKTGAAATLRDELTISGYAVLSVGNARNRHAQTTLYYRDGKLNEAEIVAKQLGEPPVALTANAIAAPADVLIVIGSDRSDS